MLASAITNASGTGTFTDVSTAREVLPPVLANTFTSASGNRSFTDASIVAPMVTTFTDVSSAREVLQPVLASTYTSVSGTGTFTDASIVAPTVTARRLATSPGPRAAPVRSVSAPRYVSAGAPMQSGVRPATYLSPVSYSGYVPSPPVAAATVCVDTNGDGVADTICTGIDRNLDGIPDALEVAAVPVVVTAAPAIATVAVDVNGDGIVDATYVGVDRNHDGIPDALEHVKVASVVTSQVGTADIEARLASLEESSKTTASLLAQILQTLEGHGNNHNSITKLIHGLPNHEGLMQGVYGLLADHISDHTNRLTNEISKLPLPPDEKVMLQAMENLQEQALGKTLGAISEIKESSGGASGRSLDYIRDHSDRIAREISSLPLPPDEKVMLQAIENMQETLLTKTMDAIGQLKTGLDDHSSGVQERLQCLEELPTHDALMKGVRGVLAEHISDHGNRITSEIRNLPLPQTEKVMLQAIENMEETVLSQTLEAIQQLRNGFDGRARGMVEHDSVIQGVRNLLAEHIGDNSSRITREINKLPLPPDEKVLLRSIENMQQTVLSETLEAIRRLSSGLDTHTKGLHGKLDGYGRSHDILAKRMEGMPDHHALLTGVRGVISEHISDYSDRMTRDIKRLHLPADDKTMLQAIENMEEAVLGRTLEAVSQAKSDLKKHGELLHGRFCEELNGLLEAMEISWTNGAPFDSNRAIATERTPEKRSYESVSLGLTPAKGSRGFRQLGRVYG